jgi:hypothetical protein
MQSGHVVRDACVIRVIRFWPISRAVMGFLTAVLAKSSAALFEFPALFGIQLN